MSEQTPGRIDISKLKNLAFEGGGGKGLIYMGAIKALEEKGLLPIKVGSDKNQIKGISGASAGAINAFLLALGATSKSLAKDLNAEQLLKFYDGPDKGTIRMIRDNKFAPDEPHFFRKNNEGEFEAVPLSQKLKDEISEFANNPFWSLGVTKNLLIGSSALASCSAGIVGAAQIGSETKRKELAENTGYFLGGMGVTGLLSSTILLLAMNVLPKKMLESFKDKEENKALKPLIEQILKHYEDYISNLLAERGLFPGTVLRQFFQDKLEARFPGEAKDMPFGIFKERTGVDLRVVSVNLTQARPQLFSADTTPDFPVVDAVCMAQCYPFAFKPIHVIGCSDKNDKPLDGHWCDGGVLNNIPLHAFDTPENQTLEGMLAIKLDPFGTDNITFEQEEEKENENEPKEKEPSRFGVILSHLGQLFNVLMFPNEGGQIRFEVEKKRILALDTSGLDTLEFSPSIDRLGARTIDAFIKTMNLLRPTDETPLIPPVDGSPKKYDGKKLNEKEITDILDNLTEEKIEAFLNEITK